MFNSNIQYCPRQRKIRDLCQVKITDEFLFFISITNCFCFRYIISSLEQESPKMSCIGVSLNKDLAVAWIHHIKKILEIALCYLEHLNPESPHDAKTMTVYLHLLVIC